LLEKGIKFFEVFEFLSLDFLAENIDARFGDIGRSLYGNCFDIVSYFANICEIHHDNKTKE
jgi:hypothetical protein